MKSIFVSFRPECLGADILSPLVSIPGRDGAHYNALHHCSALPAGAGPAGEPSSRQAMSGSLGEGCGELSRLSPAELNFRSWASNSNRAELVR